MDFFRSLLDHCFPPCEDSRHNVSDRCNQLWQEAQQHADGERACCRIERSLLGGQRGKTVEDADGDENEGKSDCSKELNCLSEGSSQPAVKESITTAGKRGNLTTVPARLLLLLLLTRGALNEKPVHPTRIAQHTVKMAMPALTIF